MAKPTRIELARESEAVDLERFAVELGLHPHRHGRIVEMVDAPDTIGDAVTSWLAEWHDPLVPTKRKDGAVSLRPPAA